MKKKLDMDQIASGLGAQRRGEIKATGGYFGAVQLGAEVAVRFKVPPRGGRATDPSWTQRRLVPLAPNTLKRLEEIAKYLHVSPLQAAALLLEKAVESSRNEDLIGLVPSAAGGGQ